MEDDFDRYKDMFSAAMAHISSFNVNGPGDPKTTETKERLEHELEALISHENEVDMNAPQLRVVQGGPIERESPFRPPERDERCWPHVKSWLIGERQLSAHWIDYLHDERGMVYADERGRAVFLRLDSHGEASGAVIQGTGTENAHMSLVPETRDDGWFRVARPGRDNNAPPTLILAQSPIEALSCMEMSERGRDTPDGHTARGLVMAISMDAVEGEPLVVPHDHIRATLEQGGDVRVATVQGRDGQRVWDQVHEAHPQFHVQRLVPSQQDWNDHLRYTKLCISDPEAARKQDEEMQRQNPPSPQSREAVDKAVRRLGPRRERGKDGPER